MGLWKGLLSPLSLTALSLSIFLSLTQVAHDDLVEEAAGMLLTLAETHPHVMQEGLAAQEPVCWGSGGGGEAAAASAGGGGGAGESGRRQSMDAAVTRFRVQRIEQVRGRPTSMKEVAPPQRLELARSLSQRQSEPEPPHFQPLFIPEMYGGRRQGGADQGGVKE